MKYFQTIFLILICVYTNVFAQTKGIEIQEIKPEKVNSIIIKALDSFIIEKEKDYQLFKDGYGFIVIDNLKYIDKGPIAFNPSPNDSDSKNQPYWSFYIGLASFPIRANVRVANFLEDSYPIFYMEYKNHLVLFNDEQARGYINNNFDIESQKKIELLVSKYLMKAVLDEDFIFTSITKDKYKLSSEKRQKMSPKDIINDAIFVFNEGYEVTVFKNLEFTFKKSPE